MNEIWKDIKCYEGVYQVSNLGKIKNVKTGRILKLMHDHRGYQRLGLRNNGEYKAHKVHRLVATAFLDNPCNHPVINHIDGNKKNNNVNNLEWCTQSHNVRHSFKLGLSKIKGVKCREVKANSRFADSLIEEMVLYKENHSYEDVCKKFNVSENHACKLITKGRIALELNNLKKSISDLAEELEADPLTVFNTEYYINKLKELIK